MHRTRAVAIWLFAIAALVAVMVGLGGLTRLTGSGLSMVEWNPHHLLPPLTDAEWQDAFAKYQASPQGRETNPDLAGFQSIFWLEYVHRLWGRLIGVAFALPLLVFALRRRIGGVLLKRLVVIFLLGAAQGGLGWFMVASGLVDRPEVSHFRLAAHLLLALAILAALLWTALDVVGGGRDARAPWGTWLAAGLAGLTITWGALVAGLDAGLVYNTFPMMGDAWLPGDGLDILHTHGAVQFAHRGLALSTVLALTLLALASRSRRLALAAGWSWLQAGLGIATLLNHVPISLASLHQMGAVVLVALLTWTLHGRRSG